VAPEIETFIGIDIEDRVTGPRRAGFHEQVAIMFGADPEVETFMHPGIRTLSTLKVTLDATLKLALI
jgi:hypothetical protein